MAGTLAEFVRNMKKPTFVLMCGSSRKGSHNAKLLESVRSRLAAEDAACEVVDLDALQLPIYSQDLETASMPRAAVELKEKLVAATGFVIACPEYNGMPTPLLLNAITWATRGEGGMYAGFQNKCASVVATSPGPMGGLRMVRTMHTMLQDMGAVVITPAVALGGAGKIFDDGGALVDARSAGKVDALCGQLMHFARFQANRDKDDCIVRLINEQKVMGEYGSTE